MPQPDQLQQFENFMADGILAEAALFAAGAVLYQSVKWGLNAYDSFKELREIKKFEKEGPRTAINEQLLESSLPIRDVMSEIDEHEQRENRIRSAMDRRARLGKRGGKMFADQLFESFPSTSGGGKSAPASVFMRSTEEYAADVADNYRRTIERQERYPETGGFSPEELDRLTEMAGGPRKAAHLLGFAIDPQILIHRAEQAEAE